MKVNQKENKYFINLSYFTHNVFYFERNMHAGVKIERS